ncbi:MAG: GNAT family N-acetyltransferase [Chitinophagaceae bacterium]|nr:GNAT family N-acetyltransferase [Chitinophagaceae bacterium]
MITVKKVDAEAIPVIQNLANITWPVTYGEILTAQQLDYMMELIYSKPSLQKQMEKGQQFIIACDEEQAVGFAAFSPKETSTLIYKLHKIYILPNQQGKGIGRHLLQFITEDILPATTLQLNVNRHNKALHFYEKTGFKIIGEEDIDIGNGFYMNDYVMELKW